MSEVGAEIIKTKETKESEIKYLNINVSNGEVERNPDIVRLCADAGFEEYVKQKTGHWIKSNIGVAKVCSVCDAHMGLSSFKFCPNCGAKMER